LAELSADDGGKKARSPGRARSKPLKPLRRESWAFPVNLWWLRSCALLNSHARLRVQRAPGFPCALCYRRDIACKSRAHRAARTRTYVYLRCLELNWMMRGRAFRLGWTGRRNRARL